LNHEKHEKHEKVQEAAKPITPFRTGSLNMPATVSLNQLPKDARAVVRRLTGGGELVSRLAGLGLVVGAPLVVLQNLGRGPILVKVRDTRIALGRGEATRVWVEEAST
jgi:ferrous iron transport protein A